MVRHAPAGRLGRALGKNQGSGDGHVIGCSEKVSTGDHEISQIKVAMGL
jgi:hypothetical protein